MEMELWNEVQEEKNMTTNFKLLILKFKIQKQTKRECFTFYSLCNIYNSSSTLHRGNQLIKRSNCKRHQALS